MLSALIESIRNLFSSSTSLSAPLFIELEEEHFVLTKKEEITRYHVTNKMGVIK